MIEFDEALQTTHNLCQKKKYIDRETHRDRDTKSMFISIQGSALRNLKRLSSILTSLWYKIPLPAIEVSVLFVLHLLDLSGKYFRV